MPTFTIENKSNNITIHASAAEAETILDAERFASEAELTGLASNWPTARLVEVWNSLPGVTEVKKFKDRATGVSRIWKAIQTLGEALPPQIYEEAAMKPISEAAPEQVAEVQPDQPGVAEPAETAPEGEPSPSTEVEVDPPVAPQEAHVAPEEAPATHSTTQADAAHIGPADEKLLRALARAFEGLTPEQAEAQWEALKGALAEWKTQVAAPKTARSETAREGSKTSQVVAMLKREGGTTLDEIMAAMGWQKHTTRAMLSAGGSLVKNHGLEIVSEKVGDNRVYRIKV